MKKIHFIAIGGAAMHNLAIALRKKEYEITGSDDEIFEPSRTRLAQHGLLPPQWGWYPEKITPDLDAVILGMHALADNPELLKAQSLRLKIYSYPEYLYEQTADKRRIVIAGSHGKTTITAMVIHALTLSGRAIDFMVGSQIEGFDAMVSLREDSRIAVFEGDEYLTSPLDPRPKFMHYKPDITLISGIAWDHINVFPTFDIYVEQFRNLVTSIQQGGRLIWYKGDELLTGLAEECNEKVTKIAYREHPFILEDDQLFLLTEKGKKVAFRLFGRHNLQNVNGARMVCREAGLTDEEFYRAISSFPGTKKRLQELKREGDFVCYLDFAHSPSKVRATVDAVRERYPDKKLTAILELHTFSSLKKEFIPHYRGTLASADEAIVYFDRNVIEHKKLEVVTTGFIRRSFAGNNVDVIDNAGELSSYIKKTDKRNRVLLLMSSGSFSGLKIEELL